MKSYISILLIILMALGSVAQAPKFLFSTDSISITTDRPSTTKLLVFKGKLTSEGELIGKSSILGDVRYRKTSIRFCPAVPFQNNTTYTLFYDNQFIDFSIPLDEKYEALQVETLYPNTAELPANFLKWYVKFSKPVNPTKIYDHLSLINVKTNKVVDRALLPLETPLLSDDGTLLTLWIEPGRQKRDLGPNKRLGSVLVEGETYKLLIDKDLKDTEGIHMQSTFEHVFTVVAADREKPDINNWKLLVPNATTNKPLTIYLNDKLDQGSLDHSLVIKDKNGKKIQGEFKIDTNKNRILFFTSTNWIKGNYSISCDIKVEDLSGNNLQRLFDQDIGKKQETPTLQRHFTID